MRLNKIAEELNINVQTLVEFIENKTGMTVDGPMTDVPDDIYTFLIDKFKNGTDRPYVSATREMKSSKTNDVCAPKFHPKTLNQVASEMKIKLSELMSFMQTVPTKKGWNMSSLIQEEHYNLILRHFSGSDYIQEANSKSSQIESLECEYNNHTLVKSECKPNQGINLEEIKFFVIDTNVLVDYPESISALPKNCIIIIPAVVLDEMDHLKSKFESYTIEHTNINQSAKYLNEDKRVSFILADRDFLPWDFKCFGPNEDCLILSVALKHMTAYPNDNLVIVTSDIIMQNRCKSVGVKSINPKEIIIKS